MIDMKKVVYIDGVAVISLNKEVYFKDLIIETLNKYNEFFLFEFKEERYLGYYIIDIKLKNDDYSLEFLVDEFLNYLLGVHYGGNS